MTAALPASALTPGFQLVPRTVLEPSATNPRKTFDQARLAELARTIAEHGILEPILARPHPDKKKAAAGVLEIVAGERRWRAAEIAKRADVPAIVRDLSDKQALEIQTIENAQREDLHPLEQADGYERLIKDFGYTPEKIADAIGKSRAHVFQIRKLRNLAPKLREAFVADEMDTTLATVLARVPGAELQAQAWQDLKREFPKGFSFRIAADFVRRNYMLDLGRAPFNIQDASLVPSAGTCGGCPKRTGNQGDLFPDVKNGNVCTDPVCFGKKRDAARAREIQTLEKKGTTVLVGAEAKRIMPYEAGWIAHGSGYAKPSERCYEDTKSRTWSQLAKDAGVAPVILQNPHSGNLEPIIRVGDVKKALEAKGLKLFRTHETSRSEAAYRAKQKAAEERVKLENQARRLILTAIVDKVRKEDLIAPPALALVLDGLWRHIWHEYRKVLAELWGWTGSVHPDSILGRVQKLDATKLARMIVQAALVDETKASIHGDRSARLKAGAQRWKIPADKIRSEVHKAARLKKAAKAAAAKQKARKAPGKVKTTKGGKK
jgi:ParB/RepB/Spo0J family partition protein